MLKKKTLNKIAWIYEIFINTINKEKEFQYILKSEVFKLDGKDSSSMLISKRILKQCQKDHPWKI